jgi:hypothetical protein
MPFGNFGACCAVTGLGFVVPAAYLLTASAVFAFSPHAIGVVAAFVSLSISPVVWRVTSRNRSSIRNKLNLKVRGI